jgi:hypothetical protein
LPAPEFGIYSTAEFLSRANQVNDLLYNDDQPYNQEWWGPQAFVPNSTGTPAPNLAAFMNDADNFDKLIERLNKLYLHGTMSPQMRATILKAYNKMPATNKLKRTKLVVNLILSSVDYHIQK